MKKVTLSRAEARLLAELVENLRAKSDVDVILRGLVMLRRAHNSTAVKRMKSPCYSRGISPAELEELAAISLNLRSHLFQ